MLPVCWTAAHPRRRQLGWPWDCWRCSGHGGNCSISARGIHPLHVRLFAFVSVARQSLRCCCCIVFPCLTLHARMRLCVCLCVCNAGLSSARCTLQRGPAGPSARSHGPVLSCSSRCLWVKEAKRRRTKCACLGLRMLLSRYFAHSL